MKRLPRLLVLCAALAGPARAELILFTPSELKSLSDGVAELPLAARLAAGKAAQAQAGKSLEQADLLSRAAIRLAPGSWALHAQRGAILLEGGRFAEAAEPFLEAARLAPRNPFPRRLAAVALHAAGRLDDAEAAARAAIKLDPRDARSRGLIGSLHMRRKNWGAAVAELKAAQSLDASHAPFDLDLGLAYEKLGLGEEARMHLTLFTRLSGLREDSAMMRAARRALARLGAQPAAAGEIVGLPGDLDAVEAAEAALRVGRADEAEGLLRRALASAPKFARAHFALADAHAQRGRTAEALAAAAEAVRLAPSHAGYRLGLARVLRVSGRGPDALPEVLDAVRRAPHWPEAFVQLGMTYAVLRRPAETLDAADRALALAPENGMALALRGHALRLLGRPQEAVAVLDAAQYAMPRFAVVDYDLGLAHKAAGNAPMAEYHLAAYLRQPNLRPDDHRAAEARAALAELR